MGHDSLGVRKQSVRLIQELSKHSIEVIGN